MNHPMRMWPRRPRLGRLHSRGRLCHTHLLAAVVWLAGCSGNLPRISDRAVITVWRSMPGRGLRTGARVIAADLQRDREVFLQFYRDARQVGVCRAVELERSLEARGLMIVNFSERGGVVRELHLLQDRDGQPLATGHGPLDVFAREPNSPEYRYRRADVEALHKWFLNQPPEADAGAPRPTEKEP